MKVKSSIYTVSLFWTMTSTAILSGENEQKKKTHEQEKVIVSLEFLTFLSDFSDEDGTLIDPETMMPVQSKKRDNCEHLAGKKQTKTKNNIKPSENEKVDESECLMQKKQPSIINDKSNIERSKS